MSRLSMIEALVQRLGGAATRRTERAPVLREALLDVQARPTAQAFPDFGAAPATGDDMISPPLTSLDAGPAGARSSPYSVTREEDVDGVAYYVARTDDGGFAGHVSVLRDPRTGEFYPEDIMVRPDLLRQGIGTELMRAVERDFGAISPSTMTDDGRALWAATQNRRATESSRVAPQSPDGGGAGAQNVVSSGMHPAFEGMTREEFLGSPRITTNRNAADLKPKALTTVQDQPAQPFLGGRYQVRMSEDGAAVYDGDRVIASYNFGDTLVVDPARRREGIAQELVYQWRTRYPVPAVARERTRASQAIQEQVWERIQRDPGNGGGSNNSGPASPNEGSSSLRNALRDRLGQ